MRGYRVRKLLKKRNLDPKMEFSKLPTAPTVNLKESNVTDHGPTRPVSPKIVKVYSISSMLHRMETSNFKGNSYYMGERNDLNQRHGNGTQFWNDGSRYDGDWEEDLPHG